MVSSIIGKLVWAGGLIAIVVLGVIYFAGDMIEEENKADISTTELEEKIEAAKNKTLDDLQKFLDGEESDKKLKAEAGQSQSEGKSLAAGRKIKRELEGEALDLERLLEEENQKFKKDEGLLAEGATDLNQEVMWRVVGDWVYFRISFSPFDVVTNKLMQEPDEAVFMCFNDDAGQRVVPASASARIPMQSLYVLREDEKEVGWAFSGKLSVAEVDSSTLNHSRVGWIFSNELHAHLKNLKDLRTREGDEETQRISRNEGE